MCSKVKIGKALCSLEPLIGQYYGIQFALAADGQTLEFKRPKTERWAKLFILYLLWNPLHAALS
jgi:hypothetical protein